MEDGIDLVAFKTVNYLGGICDITLIKCKIAFVVECPRIIKRRTIVQLVERDDIVVFRVCKGKVAD